MGTNKTPNTIRGFLIPHDFDSSYLWNAESTFTNADTQPAQPIPGGDYDLGLTATGTHDTNSPYIIQTQRAGHVERASFVWKEEGETDFYGYDASNVLSRWDSIIDGTTLVLDDNVLLDSIGNDDGTACILYQYKENTVGNTRTIKVAKRDKNGTVTTTDLFQQTSTSTPTLYGGLCRLSDGSILAVYMKATATNANLQTARSYDNGGTWYVVSKTCLPTDIDIDGTFGAGNTGVEINRIRVAESRGEILLIIGAYSHNTSVSSTDIIIQKVSTDNGCSFVHVATTGGSNHYYRPDLIVKNNSFWLGYIAATGRAEIIELESATIEIDTALLFAPTEITDELVAAGLTNGHFTIGEFSMWTNETGRIFAVFFDASSQELFFMLQSDDAKTWYYTGGNPLTNRKEASQIYNIDDTNSRPSILAGCNARGINQLFHNYEAVGTRDNGIHVFELGGWTTVSMPPVVAYPDSFDFGGWDRTWVAYDKPDSTAEYTAFGTGTIGAFAKYAQFTTTIGNYRYVRSAAITTTSDEGIIVRTRLQAVSQGHSLTGRGVNITTTNNEVTAWISLTGVVVYDEEGSTTIGSYNFDTTETFELLMSVHSNKVKAWILTNAEQPENKRWIEVANGSVASSASNPSQYVIFGHITPTTGAFGNTITRWYETHFSFGSRTGIQITEQSNPEDLNARQYAPKGQYLYLSGGVKISTFDGPGYEGEQYTINPDSTYPIRRIFHTSSPTPRQTWRSSNETQQTIAFYWDKTLQSNANSDLGSDSIGVYLGNINFRTFDVEIYDTSSTSWVNIASVNNKIAGSTWERNGNTIRSTNAAATGVYIAPDECKGYSFDMGGGIVRKIKGNTAGYLNNTTTSKRAVLFLEDFANSDPTTIATGYLIPDQICTLIHREGATAGAAIRIVIDAQDTAAGYFQIGSFMAGAFVAPQQYSNGRTITYTPGIDTSESTDGVLRTVKNHDGYRQIRIAWTTGIDMSEIYDNVTSADYYKATTNAGSLPISAPADTPLFLFGTLRRLDGSMKPLVYLPNIDVTFKTTTFINRRDELLYSVIEGDISIEHVVGDENESEVFRVSTINLREII